MKIKVGIAGAGLAGRWHAHAAVRSGADVIAIIDTDSTKASAISKHYSKSVIFRNLSEMVGNQKPDAIHICTPTSTHFELASEALSHGINVMLEKPMAENLKEVRKLYELAEAKKLLLCPVHQFLFQDGVQKILTHVSEAGELVRIEVVIRSAGGEWSKSEDLDGIAFDILPHPLSLLQLFIQDGIPDSGWSIVHNRSGELQCNAVAHSTSLALSISMSGRPPVCSLSIVGTRGTFYANLFHGSAYFERGSTSQSAKILRPFSSSLVNLASSTANLVHRIICWEPAYPGMRRLISAFYDSIKNSSKNPISAEDAIRIATVRDVLIQQIRFDSKKSAL